MTHTDAPFGTIESAHEFMALLCESIDEALDEVRQELEVCAERGQERRLDGWRVALYTTTKLRTHVATSRRLLNDLRTLRNLLHRHSDGSALPGAAPVALVARP